MDPSLLIFLSSGLFLGWSLGANDAANVFGTAVGSRMVRFATAAVICAVFIGLGAVFGGAGASEGLGELGAVNALPGAFVVALAAGLTVTWMTNAGLPVSTTQAIVGAILGWNLFSNSPTDRAALGRIVITWLGCPLLAAAFSAALYKSTAWTLGRLKPHLLRLDAVTRLGLVLAGAFGSYSLGANNIGNVMGVFVGSMPFHDSVLAGGLTFSATQKLFLIGSIAIGVGVLTHSRRVMLTVGSNLMPLTPVAAWVVVVAHSLVLYLFSAREVETFLHGLGLPALPLIPVSSSQAIVGAVIGIGLLKGRPGLRQINWRVLGNIAGGWVLTPITAAILCLLLLFIVQHVFDQQVFQ